MNHQFRANDKNSFALFFFTEIQGFLSRRRFNFQLYNKRQDYKSSNRPHHTLVVLSAQIISSDVAVPTITDENLN